LRETAPSSRRITDQLLKVVEEEIIDLDFIAALAGDRPPTAEHEERIERARRARGARFYSDVLFTLSHQYFPYEQAEGIWEAVLQHKAELLAALGRNVGIVVAALDYLSNVLKGLPQTRLIAEPKLEAIAEIAVTDGLTALFDRTTFEHQLRYEIERHRRYGNEVTLLIADIDDFKAVNDAHGHPQGDAVLSRIGELIRDEIRDVDLAFRYGGEEFALILPETPPMDAATFAERLRHRVQNEFDGLGVTISLGLAHCPTHGREARHLIREADAALYQAKATGKNRVVLAGQRRPAP
jgi:diguanylate cyclase (GGDEF)-like protein